MSFSLRAMLVFSLYNFFSIILVWFFTIEVIGKTATVKLNVNHRFHNKLYENLAKELDTTNVEIVDFMLMAWTRVEDELSVTSIKKDDFTKIREKWGQILTELLEEQEQLLN